MNKLIENMSRDELEDELKRKGAELEDCQRRLKQTKKKQDRLGVRLSQIRTELQFNNAGQTDKRTVKNIKRLISNAESNGLISRLITEVQ